MCWESRSEVSFWSMDGMIAFVDAIKQAEKELQPDTGEHTTEDMHAGQDIDTPLPVRKSIQRKTTKWGRCEKCHLSLRPYIFKSGNNSGETFFVCSGFFQRVGTSQRRCWWRRPVGPDEFHRLPIYINKEHKGLTACLRRNGRVR